MKGARESLLRIRMVDRHVIEFDEATSRRMATIHRANTAPDLRVRSALHASGLRYRIGANKDLPGSPDVANRSHCWAVFVNGCYWHRHSKCPRATTPRRNTAFWMAKFAANVARDARVKDELEALGYAVLVVWECETEAPALLNRIIRTFRRRVQRRTSSQPR